MARHIRSLRTTSFLLLLAPFCAALPACTGAGGHGKYTAEHLSEAQERMSMLKSGTEWQMAHQEFLAGDLDKALKTVDRSIAMNEKVPKSHVLRGRILLEKSRLEEARQEFLLALKIDPKFVEGHYYLGIVYERVNQPDEALACYRQAAEIDSANAQYVVAGAEMLINQNRLDEADALLEERRQFLQYNPAVRQTQGQIAELRGDPKHAAQLFSEALLLAPGDQSITEDLIQAQMACAQYADAESHIAKLLEVEANKSRRDLKSMQARCLIALNRPVDARTILEEITSDKEGSSDLRSWVELGNVCAILHDKGGLRTSMQRVMAMAPDQPDGYMLKAMFCRQDNRLADAIAAADQAISKVAPGGNVTPYILKSIIQQDQGRIADARATLIESQKIDPRNPQVAALLGSIDHNTVAGHPDAQN